MKKLFIAVLPVCLCTIHAFAQPYQDKENQRLSTTDGPTFTNLVVQHHAYPQIIFKNTTTNTSRILFSDGNESGILKYRYNDINDVVMLHTGNISNYAPSLTGAGASGNWHINASNSDRLTSLTADFSQYGSNLGWIGGLNADNNRIMPFTATQTRSFLGIPSNGETLQSVTDRGGLTSAGREIQLLSSDGETYTYLGGGASYARIGGFRGGSNAAFTNLAICEGGGNVGIGTTSPLFKLDVNGNSNFSGAIHSKLSSTEGGSLFLENPSKTDANASSWAIYNMTGSYGDGLNFWKYLANGGENSGPQLQLFDNGTSRFAGKLEVMGKMAIGTYNPKNYELAVEGTIGARKLKVTQEGWPDYVFDSSFQLKPLLQVEKFIQENKHLPDVPSAAMVNKEGIDVGDNQAILLKKIEELTLYIIRQSKEMQEQKIIVEELVKEVKILKETK